jgi:hypothetical protein
VTLAITKAVYIHLAHLERDSPMMNYENLSVGDFTFTEFVAYSNYVPQERGKRSTLLQKWLEKQGERLASDVFSMTDTLNEPLMQIRVG